MNKQLLAAVAAVALCFTLTADQAEARHFGGLHLNAGGVHVDVGNPHGGGFYHGGQHGNAFAFAAASGSRSSAIGGSSTASGAASTAVGREAMATTTNATALGFQAVADQVRSTAIGTGANTTRNDQIMLGVATTTYTAPGITSAASLAAQTGTLEFVTSDTSGNLATQAMGAAAASATAFGAGSLAVGPGDTAIGQGTTVLSDNGTAIGDSALIAADSMNATAIGQNAQALATGTTAIGQGSAAVYEGSTVIGQGAVSTRAAQVSLGTAGDTYTLSGVASDASRAAQTGPLELVTTDAAGNIATDGGALFNSFASDRNLASVRNDVQENREGIALALAVSPPDFVSGETFGLKMNFGTFEGESAVALSAAGVVARNVFGGSGRVSVDAGIGLGLDDGTVGGRVGMQLTW